MSQGSRRCHQPRDEPEQDLRSPKLAVSPQPRTSADSASSRPPPSAYPVIAATTGCGDLGDCGEGGLQPLVGHRHVCVGLVRHPLETGAVREQLRGTLGTGRADSGRCRPRRLPHSAPPGSARSGRSSEAGRGACLPDRPSASRSRTRPRASSSHSTPPPSGGIHRVGASVQLWPGDGELSGQVDEDGGGENYYRAGRPSRGDHSERNQC